MRLADRFSRGQFTAATALATAIALLLSGTALAQTTADAPSAVTIDDSCNDVPETGFTDVPGSHTFDDEIGCLKAYGFTEGAGGGSIYEPGKFVPRWQMVTFIARVAGEFDDQMTSFNLPAPSDQGFDDIAELEQRFQDSINQMAEIGVVFGKDADTFAPHGRVKRGQMASFINRLQGAVQDSEGGIPDGFESSVNFFTDDEGAAAEHEDNINALASVGIVQGKASGVYDPNASVTRGQMAAFIMRHFEVNVDQERVDSQYPAPSPSEPIPGDSSPPPNGSTPPDSSSPPGGSSRPGGSTSPAEAPSGAIELEDDGDSSVARVNVFSTNTANNSFVGCDIQTDGVTGDEIIDQSDCATYHYDSGDMFTVGGDPTATLTAFENALSVNDDVTGTYAVDPAGVSSFVLTDESATDAAGPTAVDATFLDDYWVATPNVFGDEIFDYVVITYDEHVVVSDGDTVTLDEDGDTGDTGDQVTYICGTELATCTAATSGPPALTIATYDEVTTPDTVITGGTSVVVGTTGVTDAAGNPDDGFPMVIDMGAATGPIPLDDGDSDASDTFVNVESTNKRNNTFLGCDIDSDGVTGVEVVDDTDCRRYSYDANDTFVVDGITVTLGAFEEALSVNDDVTGYSWTYRQEVSTFNLMNENS